MTSCTSVLLPLPLTPVTAVRVPSGILTSTPLRLWRRAPRTVSQSGPAARRTLGTPIRLRPDR